MTTGQRRLVMLRHAESNWTDGVSDMRRPLTGFGRRDAPAAGRWLRDHVGRLDAVVCSPAERARQTWELAATELDGPPAAHYDDRVYGAPPETLLAVLRDLPDTAATVLLIGHNPGAQDLVALLSGQQVGLDTCSVAVLAWTGSWSDDPPTAALQQYATPR